MSTGGDKGNKRSLYNEESSKRRIVIKILGPEGDMTSYRVKRDTPFQKLFMKFCEHKQLEYRAMDFIWDGARVPVRRTPDELHMEDEEQIDAMVRCGGGGGRNVFKQAKTRRGWCDTTRITLL
ncbi:hypothetical protein ACH5RR_032706 [Cinchona calisaya]|uniref:Rad60/SUMO-like domain-containing protein n=1 Tax=Cinchona calisaya TaxID=153742 RepID=A0ABD2YN22_9GENT